MTTAAPAPNLLFVDDEPNVLRALRRGMRRYRKQWNMSFALGADEALAEMSAKPTQLVISDISMPGIDGIELLRRTRADFPDTARILVSGTADATVTMKSVAVAQRFLAKPFDIEHLAAVVADMLELRALVADPDLRPLFNQMGALGSVPTVYAELCRVLDDETAALVRVADVVHREPALVARVLHIVNSAFFRAPEPVSDVATAVRYLGTRLLRDLVLMSEVFSSIDPGAISSAYDVDGEQSRALVVGQAAAAFVGSKRGGDAYTAGLLSGVGRLALATAAPARWTEVASAARAAGEPLHVAERDQFGTDHAAVAGYLLGSWGLPGTIVGAVAHHNAPAWADTPTDRLAQAVYVANRLADEQAGGPPADADEAIASAGLAERVSELRDQLQP